MAISYEPIFQIARKVIVPPPPKPSVWEPRLPSTDDQLTVPSGQMIEEGVGLCAIIQYRDAKGDESERRITIKDVYDDNGDFRIDAWCHERAAWRQFVASRIISFSDASTGEIWEHPEEVMRRMVILADFLGDDVELVTSRVLRRARPAANILLFISRCDGHEHPAEFEVVLRHVDKCADGARYDEARVERILSRLRPEHSIFERSLKQIVRFNPAWLRYITRDAKQVIEADGYIHPEETRFGAQLFSKLKELSDT